MSCSTNIQIAIRVRPFIAWEKKSNLKPSWQVKENSIVQIQDETYVGEPYSFDHIFDEAKSNKDVYKDVVKPLVLSCLEGINSSIFAYGQTSSGKTHTMMGDKDTPGIIGLAIGDVFRHMEENSSTNFLLRCSYLEIYNEKINDLLDTDATDLKIREDISQGVHVIAKEEIIRTPEDLFTVMKKGMKTRKVGCTDMNERSSRSHSIFKLVIQSQPEGSEGSYTESTLSLVDLAGSERVGQMKMDKDRQQEGVSINKSLTTLGLVIRKLSEGENFINYRDSKLTRILQHSLGGNSKTLIIATITVAVSEETKSTLEFAQRAKFVKNRPVINRKVTDKDQLKQYESLCQNFQVQIEKLMLEKLDKEKTINALKDKIHCIEKFSDSGKTSTTRHRLPPRRHTFAHLKPDLMSGEELALTLLPIEEECDKYSEAETPSMPLSFSQLIDDNEPDLFEDQGNAITPFKMLLSERVSSPKTPISKVRLEKELLQESYEHLLAFTNLENQVRAECDQFNEMRELAHRLRDENLKLKEDRAMIKYRNSDLYNQLIELQKILTVELERHPKQSLDSIPEEKLDQFIEDIDISFIDLEINDDKSLEDIQSLREQLRSKDQTIEALKEDLNKDKLVRQSDAAQINKLKEELKEKESNIEVLKARISDDRNIKEAELNILNSKIEKLTNYKEEMHIKLSQFQRTEEGDNIECLQQQNRIQRSDMGALKLENNKLLEEVAKCYETITTLEQQLHTAVLDLEHKNNIYNAILRNYSEKNALVSTLEVQIEELQSQQNGSSFYEEDLVDKFTAKLEESEDLMKLKNNEIDYLKNQCENQSRQYNQKVEEYDAIVADHKILTELLSEQRKHTEENKSKLSLLQEANDGLKANINKLVEENNHIKNELQEVTFQLTGEQKELENLCQQLESKCERNTQLDLALSELKNAREEQTRHITELTSTNLSLKHDLSKKDKELQDLIESNVKLTEQCQSLKQHFEEQTRHIDELSSSNVFLKQDMARNDEELKYLTGINETLKQDFDAQTKSNSILQQDITKKSKELEDLINTNEKLIEECCKLKQNFAEQSKRIEELSSSSLNLQEDVAKKDKELQELTETNAKLNEQCRSVKQGFEEQIRHLAELSSSNAILKKNNSKYDELKDIRQLNEKLKEHFEAQTKSISVLQQDLTKKDKEVQDLTKTNGKVTEQWHDLKQKFEEQQKYIEELSSSKFNLEKDVAQKDKELQELAMANEVLNEKLHHSKRHIDELTNSCEHLKDEFKKASNELEISLRVSSEKDELVNDLERKVRDLKCWLDQEKNETQKIAQSLVEKEQKLSKALSELKSQSEKRECGTSTDVEELKRSVADAKAENKKLMADVDNNSKVIGRLQGSVDAQQTEISMLTTKLQMKERELDEKEAVYNKVVKQLEETRKDLERRSSAITCFSSKLNGQDTQGKAGEVEKLYAERDSLKARIEELEKQAADSQMSIKQHMQVFTNVSRQLRMLQDEKNETDQKDMSKLPQERRAQIGFLRQCKERVTPKQHMKIAHLFGSNLGKTVGKLAVQDVASQTGEIEQKCAEHSKFEALIEEYTQELEKHRTKLENLMAILKNSAFKFESWTLEDQIQELLLSVKRDSKVHIGNISQQEAPSKPARKSDERKCALRVSDEMRRVKERRQSIHDQRRGLSPDVELSLSMENFDCEDCTRLRSKLSALKGQIPALKLEVDKLRAENEFLDKEGEQMLQIIQSGEKTEMELYDKLAKYEDCRKVDKETQASCDLQEKYNALKKLVKLRRREGNQLRAMLNLSPDCPISLEP